MPKSKKFPDNQITVYQTPDGKINIEVLYANENIWLSQKRIAELFGCSPDNVSLHLKNIYKDNELEESATAEDFSVVQMEGSREVTRTITCYSLEAIIAVGYRVNSERGIQFRQWAISILQQYIHKGFAIDGDRFKYGSRFSTRFFDELLEEIRDIRSSERMAYQKITDIYATSIDYSLKAEDTKKFFATVQNKLHFAITGQTAAEIIANRVDSTKPNMGLTSWRKSPKGKIRNIFPISIGKSNGLRSKNDPELSQCLNTQKWNSHFYGSLKRWAGPLLTRDRTSPGSPTRACASPFASGYCPTCLQSRCLPSTKRR